ncbi:Phosphatidylglycerophosphate synthase [Micromonospora sediminicola]|uniref:Phosphatidylglycerophosphate synthase n=1 Tax=Micromonospora sediminicola TaxID=946078 RepID=A0A1A9BIU5_9ACTN|nr:Phosphatidylglycerophosphate synthase [Micromonospora sediminicola]
MTLAIVLAAGPAAGRPTEGGEPPADRLAAQWRRAGADDVRIAADLAELADLVAGATGPVLVSGVDLVAHTAVLKHLATSPVGPTVALVLTDPPAAGQATVREERGQVVEAGAVADATGVFGGALRVGPADLPALAEAARRAAGGIPAPASAPDPRPTETASAPGVGAVGGGPLADLDRLVADLAARGTLIFAHRVRLLVAHRAGDAAQRRAAEAQVAAVDEDRAELKLSVKERDDFFTTFFVSTWSPYVTKAAARIGIGPTGVTMVSVAFAVAAAVLFGVGGRPALVAGAVLLYLGFVLDCVDGQLARYTRHFSAWGGWLDTMADRFKEYVVYAGLGYGATHAGFRYGWALALAAMTLQTVRHMTDTWYGALHDEAARRPKVVTGDAGGIGGKLNAASTRVQADTGSVSYWLKRTVVFPIGERWALIALAAALFGPLVALCAVLVWGTLAFAYTGALRTLRARWMKVPVLTTVDAGLHRDDGLLTRTLPTARRPLLVAVVAALGAAGLLVWALWAVHGGRDLPHWAAVFVLVLLLGAAQGARAPHAGALDWLVPAALRAAEYLFAIAVGVAGRAPAWLIFAYVLVLTLHHYDLTARLEKRQSAPPLHAVTLGWEGRSLLLGIALIAGIASIALATLGTYLLVVFVASVVLAWVVLPARARGGAPSPG